MELDHVAVIVSSEKGVEFYKELGFKETERIQRPEKNDVLIWTEGHGMTLELFIRDFAPDRPSEPEAKGCRHIAFKVDNLEDKRKELIKFNPGEIRDGCFFIKDPDGQPIEFIKRK